MCVRVCVQERERERMQEDDVLKWNIVHALICFWDIDLIIKYFAISGNGEFANFNKIKGAVAGSKPDQSSKSLWAEMH